VTPQEFLDHAAAESERFVNSATGSLDKPVAALDWTVRDLTAHLGAVYVYAGSNASISSSDPAAIGDEARAPEGDAILDWFDERRNVLLSILREVDDEAIGWTHAGPQKAAWWKRRMACETAVHRWDLDFALHGVDAEPIPFELAAAAIDEYFEVGQDVAVAQPGRNIYPSTSLHLHCSDGPGEWMMVGNDQGGLTVTHEHGKGDAAVRGPASQLLLWIWGRPVSEVQVFGDDAVAAAWQALAS